MFYKYIKYSMIYCLSFTLHHLQTLKKKVFENVVRKKKIRVHIPCV